MKLPAAKRIAAKGRIGIKVTIPPCGGKSVMNDAGIRERCKQRGITCFWCGNQKHADPFVS